jgi:hypothetical protein
MHLLRRALIVCFLTASTAWLDGASPSAATQPTRLNADGSLDLAGHRLRCDNVRTRLDRRLPNLGAAEPESRLLLINPILLGREQSVVQLFVFHHECGHHRIGASELGADCWAVDRGVESGWLDRAGLKSVCDSFGGAAETATHPSARRRCANLDRCFSAALARWPEPARPATQPASAHSRELAPKLVRGPVLVRSGVLR